MTYDFLLVVHYNYMSVMYLYRDKKPQVFELGAGVTKNELEQSFTLNTTVATVTYL